MWKGRSTAESTGEYVQHATKKVFPELGSIKGYREAFLLRRALDEGTEFLVLTLWDSMEAIRKFAGAEPEKAVVEPAARAILTQYDETVTHFEVVLHSEPDDI
jgi:heme-degrading monooxygenase HmoA